MRDSRGLADKGPCIRGDCRGLANKIFVSVKGSEDWLMRDRSKCKGIGDWPTRNHCQCKGIGDLLTRDHQFEGMGGLADQ